MKCDLMGEDVKCAIRCHVMRCNLRDDMKCNVM